MTLYKEYFQRHAISMSMAEHCSNGTLIFKKLTDAGFQWTVLKINWQTNNRGPGWYNIYLYRPRRQGGLGNKVNGPILFDVLTHKEIKWDQYENFMIELINNIDLETETIIKDFKEIICAFWEMFVYSNDDYFANRMRQQTLDEDTFWKSLNFNSPVADRYVAYKKFMDNNFDAHFPPFRAWRTEINNVTQNYCHWLVDLIANAN